MKKITAILLLLSAHNFLFAQGGYHDPAIDSSKASWNLTFWVDYFIIPGDKTVFNPTFYADHKSLHLEGRYNYEDFNTGSVFTGWKIKTGDKVQFVITPMLGIVFGQTNGIAPGFELEIKYKILDLYSENEYLIDFSGHENNYIFTNTELAVRPFKNVRVGITGLRTRLYETDLDIQRGIFAEYYFKKFRIALYYFNPFTSSNVFDISFSIDF